MAKSIYKSPEIKEKILHLYDKRLADLDIEYEESYVDTFAGKTHVIICGKAENPPLILLHGINAGAPLALGAVKGLLRTHRIYAVDSVGQSTKSAETRLPLKGNDYGIWLAETLEQLGLEKATFIGVSFGAYLLQKIMSYAPDKVDKAIFVVPAGLANGDFIPSTKRLTIPLIRYMITKKESDLIGFMNAFYTAIENVDIAFQKLTLRGLHMDYRRPVLVEEKEMEKFTAPVFAIFADDDVFFPYKKSLERCKRVFKNFQYHHVLANSKHVPSVSQYQEIEKYLKNFLTLGL